MNSHLRSRQRLALNPHLVPSPAATLTPPPLPYLLTPAPLHRERGDLCGFAEPSARGSTVMGMVVEHFRKTEQATRLWGSLSIA